MYAQTVPYLVASRCDTMKKHQKNIKKTTFKTLKIGLTLVVIYLCIPMIPWYRYTVCCSVPNSTIIPIPPLSILE